MQLPSPSRQLVSMHQPLLSTLLLPLLLAASPASAAGTLDCNKIRVDGQNFDLSKLSGPHSVVTSRFEPDPDRHYNTTYTLDICKPLGKKGGKKGEECPNGTRVCGIRRLLKDDIDTIDDVIAIAGALENSGGSHFDVGLTRLKTSDSTSDAQKEGVRIVLQGGKHPLNKKEQRAQKAIVEFICDPKKEGTEGEWESEDKYETLAVREEEDKGDGDTDGKKDGEDGKDGKDKDGKDDGGESSVEYQLKKDDAALVWDGYAAEKDVDVLRLTWHTKYACEKREDGGGGGGGDDDGNKDDSGKSESWGFFTWFILIAFLGIASYLVFSSYVNYVRYGARGWDLVPHSDAIRDVPYLLKDWVRRVLNTVQGTGSRGGYSAV